MELDNQALSRYKVDEILAHNEDPIVKVQQIVDIGIEENVANEIVERYQIGQQTAVFYEQLPLDDRFVR